jgi:hypothetical protein
VQLQRIALAQFQQQPQHRGRRLLLRLPRAHHEQQLAVLGGGHLQAAQLLGPHLRQPGQHGGHIGTAQGLLTGPQAGGSRLPVHTQQALRLQTLRCQSRAERHVWSPHQHNRAAGARQRRQQQAPLGLAALRLQDFADGAHRPAPARQLRVQARVASGHRDTRTLRQRIGLPQGGIGGDDAGKLGHKVAGSFLYTNTV